MMCLIIMEVSLRDLGPRGVGADRFLLTYQSVCLSVRQPVYLAKYGRNCFAFVVNFRCLSCVRFEWMKDCDRMNGFNRSNGWMDA